MKDHDRNPESDERVVAHVGHVPEDAHLEDIHQHRLEREERRRNLKWMVISVILSLVAAGFALFASDFWNKFQTYAPGYEPKDQSRQQRLEQIESGQQKEAP